MSAEEERKDGFIAYALVSGMIAMLAIVYALVWVFNLPFLLVPVLGVMGGLGLGFAVYRRVSRCPVCKSADCRAHCPACGCERDGAHASFHGTTVLCTCNAHLQDNDPGYARDDGGGYSKADSAD